MFLCGVLDAEVEPRLGGATSGKSSSGSSPQPSSSAKALEAALALASFDVEEGAGEEVCLLAAGRAEASFSVPKESAAVFFALGVFAAGASNPKSSKSSSPKPVGAGAGAFAGAGAARVGVAPLFGVLAAEEAAVRSARGVEDVV